MLSARWLRIGFSLALLAFTAGQSGAADDLAVQVERKGRSFAVQAGATVAAPLSLVWEVLTDYDNLARFIPGIAESVVQQRATNRLLLEQRGEARFLVFSYPIQVRLEVLESPRERIVSRAVAGNLKRMSGRYDLQAENGGIRLRYTGELEPDFKLPPIIGTLAVRNMVEEQFAAMVAEIERRSK
jgi:carbon monoxide dehydrogenase subunit G